MEKELEEFREIAHEILKREITIQEVRELALRWARNKLEVRRKHGLDVDEDKLKTLAEEHVEKILSLRRRLGLDTPE
ncbi:MAG TPA: hypothetical protein EYH45_02900 [Candidatus Caldiarchaeum subterraneum]|uniref:Uncharacterized protein n=1 Tax=Caldiarchaeum subterraneum TaxID=311458 RepID=A0A833E9I5_CALS0|nr:hypothetical protein [Candidatus Caldarchaeum subterraneum]